MFKKIILGLLVLGFTSLVLEASEKDIYQRGCEDVIAGKLTSDAMGTIGYIIGTQDMKMDRLQNMGFDAVVNIDIDDFKPICRQTLKLRKSPEFSKFHTRWSLHFVTRGYIINKNGYTWDEVKKVCKEAKKKMGLVKSSKKY